MKTVDTKIMVQMENPKKIWPKNRDKFDKYKHAKSIGEATQAGANWQDVSVAFKKGFLKLMDSIDEDIPPSTKRSAPEGTPDQESQRRALAKVPPAQMLPQIFVPEVCDSVSKVEMSTATIAPLRMTMREEFASGMVTWKPGCLEGLTRPLHEARAEVAQEHAARRQLEEKVRQLEEQHVGKYGRFQKCGYRWCQF